MRINIFIIIMLLAVTHIVSAATSVPFVDLNLITNIEQSDDALTFYTPIGKKHVQLKTNEWSYSIDPGVTFPGGDPNHYLPYQSIDVKIPVWYPGSTYLTVTCVDDLTDPDWMLVSRSGEAAVYYRQDLVNLKTGQVYSLPYENIRDFVVVDDTVWLGGALGVSKLNITSLVRTRINTLPIFRDIVSYIDTKHELYYLAHNFGLFSVGRETNEIKPVIEINSYLEKGYKFEVAKEISGKLWLMVTKKGDEGYINGPTLLLHYDPVTDRVEEIDTHVRFANKFLLYKGNTIFGYGSLTEIYEGGETSAHGGIFRYDLEKKALKVLSTKPAVFLQLNPPKAMGVWFTDGPTVIDYFEGLDLKTSFSLVKTELLTDQPEDYISTDFRSGEKVTYIGNPERLKLLRNTYNAERKTQIKNNAEVYAKVFGKLNINLKTIESPAGIVEMRQYDPHSSVPPKQHYY